MTFSPNFRDHIFLPTATAFVSAASLLAEIVMAPAVPGHKYGLLSVFCGNRNAVPRTIIVRDGAGGGTVARFMGIQNAQTNFQPEGLLCLGTDNALILLSTEENTAALWIDLGVEYILVPA